MNRLQKKCFIVATGMHLLLLVILIVGPAFLSSSSKPDDSKVLDMIPANLIDGNFSGGGGPPKPAPPAARAEQQTPVQPVQRQVEQVRAPQPDPVQVKPEPKPVRTDPKPTNVKPAPDSLEASKSSKPKPNISTVPVTRNSSTARTTSTSTATSRAEANRRLAELNKAVGNLRDNLSSSTEIESPGGFGGSGEAYESYAQRVRSIYQNAWIPPDNTENDEATAKVSVTIASDGRVISARITTPSGDKQTDASIQRTLDHVNFIAPFPKGSTDSQRSYIINFNLKAKRLSA